MHLVGSAPTELTLGAQQGYAPSPCQNLHANFWVAPDVDTAAFPPGLHLTPIPAKLVRRFSLPAHSPEDAVIKTAHALELALIAAHGSELRG